MRSAGTRLGTAVRRYVCLNEGDDPDCGRRFTDNTKVVKRGGILLAAQDRLTGKRKFIRDLKEENPCTDCGIKYSYYVMHFDHIGDDKKFSIAQYPSHNMQALLKELKKCELVCGNCHAERTHRRRASI